MKSGISAQPMQWQVGALTWVALIWCLVCAACFLRAYLNPTRGTVFHDYAHAGRSWMAGGDAYNLDHGDGQVIPPMSGFRYSPLVSVVLVPFSLFDDGYGNVLWRLFNVGCFLGAFGWYLRDGLPAAGSLADGDKAAMWLLLLPLSLVSINNGQANVLLMGLLLASAVAVIKERWNWAAGLLAGAVLLKLYPVAVALLLILAYPRPLAWRFLVAVAIGLALPFAFQSPTYVVHQYENWLTLVGSDSRRDFPLTLGYRDFYLLTRAIGAPLAPKVYLGVQLGAAALIAGVGLLGRRRGWPAAYLVTTLFTLGCCWMVVFGPSIESCTFILIAPALAWALADAASASCPRWSRYAVFLGFGMFLIAYATAWFRFSRDWCYLMQPMAAFVFLVERWLRSVTYAPAGPTQWAGLTPNNSIIS